MIDLMLFYLLLIITFTIIGFIVINDLDHEVHFEEVFFILIY